MAGQQKIVLWSRQGCQACQELKLFLDQKGYVYENVDVGGKDYLRDVLELKYGVRHVPVVEIGNGQVYEAVTDADVQRIVSLIEQQN